MDSPTKPIKKPNHLRNVGWIMFGFVALYASWQMLGAARCNLNGGEIRFSGVAMGCFLDFSGG